MLDCFNANSIPDMDPRLSNAATLGDVAALHALLNENPLILEKIDLCPYVDTPLHTASLAGKTEFVKEIILLKPSFAREANKDGFTPFHIASATGNVEMVKEFLKLGKDMSFLRDKDGQTPLHWAAIKGRVEVIVELLSHCPNAVKEVTARGETALHLAVKNNQFEALKVMAESFDSYETTTGKLVNAKDNEGNTIWQLAVATKQIQAVEFLRSQRMVDHEETIQVVSGEQFEHIVTRNSTHEASDVTNSYNIETAKPFSVKGPVKQDIWTEVRSMVFIVASFIVTATHKAGLDPPDSIWKQGTVLESKCIFHSPKRTSFFEPAGGCPAFSYYIFMSFNTAGFFASVFLILFYRNTAYMQVLLQIALSSMMITYVTVSVAVSPSVLSLLITYLITVSFFVYSGLAFHLIQPVVDRVYKFASSKSTWVGNIIHNATYGNTCFSAVGPNPSTTPESSVHRPISSTPGTSVHVHERSPMGVTPKTNAV